MTPSSYAHDTRPLLRWRSATATLALLLTLQTATPRKTQAEDRIDFKYMYYQEDNDRIRVLSPAVLLEKDFSPSLAIKIGGVYNAITGASPSGAPLVSQEGTITPAAVQPYSVYVDDAEENEQENEQAESREEDRDEEGESRESDGDGGEFDGGGDGGGEHRLSFGKPRTAGDFIRSRRAAHPQVRLPHHARAGATPAPTPTPAPAPTPAPSSSSSSSGSSSGSNSSSSSNSSSNNKTPAPTPAAAPAPVRKTLPMASVEDERRAINLELIKKLEGHTLSAQISLSSESDYESRGLALRDAIDFNKKNTTLDLGAAYTHDAVDAFTRSSTENKDTIEGMVGLTQVLGPKTLFSVNLTLGQVSGYISDQYKVVLLNNALVPEKRPDSKDKQIVNLALTHFVTPLNGSAELNYRYYNDSFGIRADTFTLSWHQKLGPQFVLSPMVRWYEQCAADFYDLQFEGSPSAYSSDYRVSALRALGVGLKLTWQVTPALALDISGERYEQEGTDGRTPDEAYPAASVLTAGVRVWF